jgi:hypothetical protein
MQRRRLFLIALMVFMGVPFATGFSVKGTQERVVGPRTVVGDWTLTTASDQRGRNVEFRVENGHVAGTYVTQGGERKAITNTRFANGRFYFEVPEFPLYFDVGWVEGRLEGTMMAYSREEKRVPEPVVLTRR